jgi:hypothetical protein
MEFKIKIRKKMNKMLLNLTLTSFMLLSTTLYADNKNTKAIDTKEKPVDEALEHKPKEDSVKGGEKKRDKQHEDEISLKDLGKTYQINRKGLNYPPYRCYIYHADKSRSQIGIINSRTISFTINKSQLKVGDTIVVANNQDTGDKNHPKNPIEWIEVK